MYGRQRGEHPWGTPLLGCRCVFINDGQYSYNVRDELISADEVSYNYDDIGIYAPTSVSEVGNRTTAEGKTYTANNLNQYTAIDDFAPQYDDDGNQTLIKTETGIWSVSYNAENRPIRWQSGDTVITMAFDRMGRRVEMRTVKDGEETLQRFVYDNYLCIQQLRGADNALFHSYVWDPTEPIATRPLIFRPASGVLSYYFHDGNKNVSDLVDIQGSVVHYDYTAFGNPTASSASDNPFRFSSELYDEVLGLAYYNYRHYNYREGRWLTRDPIAVTNRMCSRLYTFCSNAPMSSDIIGLLTLKEAVLKELDETKITPPLVAYTLDSSDALQSLYLYYLSQWGEQKVFDIWIKYEKRDVAWRDSLPKCPKSINIDTLESPGEGWGIPQPRSKMYNPEKYHPEAAYELRTSASNEVGAGNQCIYDKKGCLIETGFSVGTTDRKQAPSGLGALWDLASGNGHIAHDVEPFDLAYRLDGNAHGSNVEKYIQVRPAK